MSTFQDASVEPKNAFLNFLIMKLNQANEEIYDGGSKGRGVRILCGLVNSLHPQSKTSQDLEGIKKELDQYYQSESQLHDDDANRLYDKVSSFILDHYLTETNLGLVQTSALKGEQEKPENKPLDPKQSSRI